MALDSNGRSADRSPEKSIFDKTQKVQKVVQRPQTMKPLTPIKQSSDHFCLGPGLDILAPNKLLNPPWLSPKIDLLVLILVGSIGENANLGPDKVGKPIRTALKSFLRRPKFPDFERAHFCIKFD